MTKKTIFALAKNNEHADRIVNRLRMEGINSSEISVLFADKENKIQYADDEPRIFGEREIASSYDRPPEGIEKNTKAPEGGVVGATTGGIIGGSLGLLAGIGALAIPGFGVFIAAGPIVSALSGSAVGGALGMLLGSLVGFGIPEYEAKKYEKELRTGSVLICVQVQDDTQANMVNDLLQKEGATDISLSKQTVSY